ncbi:hypothetical protein ID866_12047, partial [Astraeus odoratus]
MVTLTCHQAVLESLASTRHSSEAGEPFVSFSACCTTPKPPPPSASARPSRPQTSHTPLSFPPSTSHPRNPGSPSDDDPGNDDDENPFSDNNSNDNDDDNNDDDYEDADNGTQEDQAIQVFKSLTHAIDSLACASRKSGSSSSQTKVHKPNTFDGTDPKKLHTFLLKGMALKWFELDLLSSGNPGTHPLWMDDWTEFVIKLQSTFRPHNPVADAENQLDHLQMKESYGNGTLCHQFYSGLPNCIKDEIYHLAQEINMCYWECKEEVQHTNKSSGTNNFPANKPSSSASNSNKGKPTTSSNTNSSLGNANSSSSNKPKTSNAGNKLPNIASSNPDLTEKLGKDGKLTLEEKKRRLDNKLCMFCREDGHFSN